jgi:CheY-like chemotaxis protein
VIARSSTLVLIVDHDLGFLMWLGELFAELGYSSVPALQGRQALALARRLKLPVTILIVNPKLRGAGRMVQVLAAANPELRLIIIRDSAPGAPNQTDLAGLRVQGSLERPLPWETISRQEWLAKIRKVLFLAAGT